MKLKEIYRVKVFVVPDYVEKVRNGVLTVDQLQVGNYENVCWRSQPGIEHFVPTSGAVPTEGEAGEATEVESVRLEFSIKRDEALLRQVIEEGIYPNHPWDEPVIQVSEELEARTDK
ncbi:hypothetical protein [Salimicrobium halophilum]|uniref:Uncharacterized protein n=1 Tax=Salimicrobium halophilum TaxID=86666 RepID=A0A1G8UG62_9BACI|nr:hypothetical protein [Salimicrobium halophilum]SDJ52637.1 hypothetical protein SAMN04490247_2240 [Salimicrobium halophilum]